VPSEHCNPPGQDSTCTATLYPCQRASTATSSSAWTRNSQYVYALPLKDKSAPSVLQGFLSLFATTGWYEALYLDNETLFQKAAKSLVKIALIAVHYSTPYCHFQNNAENYFKDFKKTFVKILNDTEHPHSNEDWPLLLPTVTQALNRKIILSLL
jgi:hypothetical protein